MYKLSTTSLTPLCYLTACVSIKIPFLSLFWSCLESLLVLGCCPLSAATLVSPLKDLCIQRFLPIIIIFLHGLGRLTCSGIDTFFG